MRVAICGSAAAPAMSPWGTSHCLPERVPEGTLRFVAKGPAGGAYHSVAEEGVPFREIAEKIGARLKVPVVSKPPAEAKKEFSFPAPFIGVDNPTSSKLTQERLGWKPTQLGVLADIERPNYSKA